MFGKVKLKYDINSNIDKTINGRYIILSIYRLLGFGKVDQLDFGHEYINIITFTVYLYDNNFL